MLLLRPLISHRDIWLQENATRRLWYTAQYMRHCICEFHSTLLFVRTHLRGFRVRSVSLRGRESWANHYSKRIMQTCYLIKNIFVFARLSLLRADVYRAISNPVVTQNPQLIALIRRDCARGGWVYARPVRTIEFSISRM